MEKQNKMTEDELLSLIDQHVTDALGYDDAISTQREKAMEYYYGLPFGNEVEGRSQFVSSDVADTIEWIMPSLMRVFASGDEVSVFNPVGPEDVEVARQATSYVNHVLMKENDGWSVIYDFCKSALLQKVGFCKVWWEESAKIDREEYSGLSDVELDALISDDDVEVIEHTANEEEEVEGENVTLHDVVIHRNNSEGKVHVEAVPPDEVLIARMTKTIQDSHCVCHRVRKTVTELREQGFDIDLDEIRTGSTDKDTFSGERQARRLRRSW